MKIGILVGAVALAATGAVAAQTADGEAVEQPATTSTAEEASVAAATDSQATPAEERKICRTEKATGSLTRRNRICLTQAQWREVNDRTRRGVGDLQGDSSGGKMCVPNPGDPFQGCS